MADVFTRKKRSEVMSRIRAKNTKPELLVRKYLFSSGLRYRIHQKSLPGQPDIVLKKFNVIVIVNGCFWHGHTKKTCKVSRMPKSNNNYWKNKILQNQARDLKNLRKLRKAGWKIFVIWECQLRGKNKEKTLSTLVDKIVKTK